VGGSGEVFVDSSLHCGCDVWRQWQHVDVSMVDAAGTPSTDWDSVFEDVGRLAEISMDVPRQALDQGLRVPAGDRRKLSETTDVPRRDDKQMSSGQGRDRRENDKVPRFVTDATRQYAVRLLELSGEQPTRDLHAETA
jgi:hypothetical protein